MDKIRESITLWQFITTSAINIIDTILFFLTYEFTLTYHALKYLTNITLYFNSTYLFLAFICDISFFILKSQKLEGFNYFLRNKFCNIINPMSYLVSLLFWILVICGGIIGSFETSKDTLFSIYAHLLITIFIIVDLFIHEHEIHKFSLITFGFIFLYIFCYMIIIIICRANNVYVYEFIEDISVGGFIGYALLFIVLTFGAYLLHIFILQLKYKYIIKNKEKHDFNEEVNKIIQMSDFSKTSTDDEAD